MNAFIVDNIGASHVWCHGGHAYSVDNYAHGSNYIKDDLAIFKMSDKRYFTDQSDALWYFKRLLVNGDSDDLESEYQKLESARQVFNEIMLYMEDDGNVLTEDCEFEGLGYYKQGSDPNDVISDFEDLTGISYEYMLGYEEEPFLAAA